MKFVPPTAEQIARTRQSIGADEVTIQQARQMLKEWLKTQPHLPDTLDDVRLEKLYVNCKGSMQRCKQAIDAYFSLRTRLPEFLQKRDPLCKELRSMMLDVKVFPMPQLTPEGYRVNLSIGAVQDLSAFEPDTYVKLFLMTQEIRLAEDYVPGDIYVIDCGQYSMGHVAGFGPARARKTELCVRTAYCSRIKAVHFVNMSQIADLLYKIVVNAFSTKLAKRVHVHSKTGKTLLDHIPPECLPNELGGNAGPVDEFWEAWKSKMISYREWFLEQDKIICNETKRPDKDPYGDGLFGCEGSFRKLQID